MLGVMLFVLGSFAFLVLRAYRRGARAGTRFEPEGKLRWTDAPGP